jgi:hypothetical protein
MGVECVVIKDTVMENGKLAEQTYDWYAQDRQGNVVKPHTRFNPGGILPPAIGVPTALTAMWLGLRATRRRQVEWAPPASG